MKVLLLGLGIVGFMFAIPASSQAQNCQQLAQNCMRHGGSYSRCYAGVPACLRTCKMVGPYTGKAFYATTGCGKHRKKHKG